MERRGRENEACSGTTDAAKLVAEASADSDTLAADGAAAAEHGCAALGLHAGTKAVGLHALAAIGLKCALGHGMRSCFLMKNLYLAAVSEYIAGCVQNPVPSCWSLCALGIGRANGSTFPASEQRLGFARTGSKGHATFESNSGSNEREHNSGNLNRVLEYTPERSLRAVSPPLVQLTL